MCGIIGVLTSNSNNNISVINCILNGLTILQNRGYDSCGIGYIDKNIIINKFSSTNVSNSLQLLKDSLREKSSEVDININVNVNCGIGHNRWATHGIKNDTNAHPHISNDGNFIIVHNGIIENYGLIKENLIKKGYKFYSQTDSEVIVALISTHYNEHVKKKKNYGACAFVSCYDSIKYALNEITGTYGIVVINRLEPNNIYCVRNGSPLLIGIDTNKEYSIITSEASGFNNLVNTYFSLDDNVICNINLDLNNKINTNMNLHSVIIKNIELSKSNFNNLLTPEPFTHWTLREIYEQPDTIMSAINNGGRIKNYKEVKLGGMELHIDNVKDIEHLVILGCGSSFNAGLYGAYFFKILSGFTTVQVIDGADLTDYDLPLSGKTAFIMITQSGETADLYRCLDIAKKRNILTIGVINVVDSLIARNVDCGVYCNSGKENAVASTKSFTSQVVCLSLIALWFSQIKNINQQKRIDIIKDLQNLSILYTETLKSCDYIVKKIASDIHTYTNLFILGKDCDSVIANEGALKIKEITYIHAEGYSASSLKHGPFALLDKNFPVILLNCNDKYNSKIYNTLEEIISRDTSVILITNSSNSNSSNSNSYISEIFSRDTNSNIINVPKCNYYNELLGLIPLQLLAYYISLHREINPDKPKNLAKVVTVE